MNQYLMAIDAGTGSVRVILFDTNGKEVTSSSSEWIHKEDNRYPGSMDFDINTNWDIIKELIKDTIEKSNVDSKQILAVSTTSMREAIVLYDENGNELWACANVDSRSVDEVTKLYKTQPNLEKEIYKISGQTFSLGAIPRILWVKNNMPETYEQVKYVSMLNDWITYKLSNIISVEPSNACTTGLFNLKSREWDYDAAKKSGIREDIFPITFESGTIIGKVTEKIGENTGLNASTLVVAGGGDAQLGCIGMGVINEGDAAVLGGSFWQYEYTTNHIKMDDDARVRVNCHAVPETWQYEAIAFFPGLVMRWFRDSFCELEKYLEKSTEKTIYEQMEEKALQVPPGSNGLMGIFSDKMNYINWKHASPSFIDFELDSEQFNKATFYRSIMENAAYATRGNIESVNEITGSSPEFIVFGGGASKSNLWCQIVSDVLNLPVKVPQVKESTALGAAICAGIGANVYNNFNDAIAKVVRFDKEFKPIEDNQLSYNKYYNKWQSIYQEQLKISDKGITDHMWIAPGL